ncbi:hypothetical protein HK099_005175 [Clydaea vesicula]|uniref:Uncharacterized protein n=1 Tax=Clydaea vesicula TaxID=447962 RepID=A0AAD5XV37_9FUNG|nr:hypothetical protein HK099_005175 [Clydaea vesicula]KAJ3385255.1 hypothetical protein HDU92_003142 [Lobulomyces angularis]
MIKQSEQESIHSQLSELIQDLNFSNEEIELDSNLNTQQILKSMQKTNEMLDTLEGKTDQLLAKLDAILSENKNSSTTSTVKN